MFIKKVYTLVFLRKNNQILLGLKKRGFGVNKWNGFGGKVEPNESIIQAAVRELKEECSICVKTNDLKNVGHLEFTFEGQLILMDVRVFCTDKYEGTPTESEEMCPKWYDCNQVPFESMWADDKIWFPYMLKGKFFYGRFHYQGLDTILNYNMEELNTMEESYTKRK